MGARGKVNPDLHLAGGVVLDLRDLQFSFLICRDNGVDETGGGSAKGKFRDREEIAFADLDPGAHPDAPSAEALVVFRAIGDASRREIRQEIGFLFSEDVDAAVDEFVEVVGKDFTGQAHGDAFCALGQEEREFRGQGDGFLFASVVREGPGSGLGIEDHVIGELREPGFDVAGGRGFVAGEDVAPVALGFDEEIFLAQLDEGVADGGIPVGMVLHGVAHHVGHLVETSVVGFLEGVEDAALDGFESVIDVRDRALEDDIGSVIQEPVAVHFVHVHVHRRRRGGGGLGLRLGFCRGGFLLGRRARGFLDGAFFLGRFFTHGALGSERYRKARSDALAHLGLTNFPVCHPERSRGISLFFGCYLKFEKRRYHVKARQVRGIIHPTE